MRHKNEGYSTENKVSVYCIPMQNGNVVDEIISRAFKSSSHIQKLASPLALDGHIRRPKGRWYTCTVRSTRIHGYETWPVSAKDLHQSQVFDHRYPKTIGHACWKQKITNKKVHRTIFKSTDKARSLADIIQHARLR